MEFENNVVIFSRKEKDVLEIKRSVPAERIGRVWADIKEANDDRLLTFNTGSPERTVTPCILSGFGFAVFQVLQFTSSDASLIRQRDLIQELDHSVLAIASETISAKQQNSAM